MLAILPRGDSSEEAPASRLAERSPRDAERRRWGPSAARAVGYPPDAVEGAVEDAVALALIC